MYRPTTPFHQGSGEAIRVNGVRLDKMLELPYGQVLDPIPEKFHGLYLARGVSLGNLALKLINGDYKDPAKNIINPGEDLYMHIAAPKNRRYAADHAKMLAEGTYFRHFSEEDMRQLQDLVGTTERLKVPSMLIGFDIQEYGHKLIYHPRSGQPVIAEPVCFDQIDGYSRFALNDLFEVDLVSSLLK